MRKAPDVAPTQTNRVKGITHTLGHFHHLGDSSIHGEEFVREVSGPSRVVDVVDHHDHVRELELLRLDQPSDIARRKNVAIGPLKTVDDEVNAAGGPRAQRNPHGTQRSDQACFLALRKSLLSWEITSSGISLGQAAAHSPMLLQPPKPSKSCWLTMLTTRASRSG